MKTPWISILLVVVPVAFPPTTIAQTTWTVDQNGGADFATVQACIDDTRVVEGDTCLVMPGTYVENVSVNNKSITLKGSAGSESTVIDGAASGPAVQILGDELQEVVLEGLTIQNGFNPEGAGILCVDTSLQVTSCVIRSNRAENPGLSLGGGIQGWGASIRIDGCTITDNLVTSEVNAWGGGICMWEGSLVLVNSTVSRNRVESLGQAFGGGIYAVDSPQIQGCTISDNVVSGSGFFVEGGGIYAGSPTISQSIITGNRVLESSSHSTGVGGGIECKGGWISHSSIIGNYVEGTGGGLCIGGGTIAINCLIAGNEAGTAGGGFAAVYNGTTFLVNCTVTDNTSGWEGGGVYPPQPLSVTNSIVWGNTPDELWEETRDAVITWSNIQGGWDGEGNIDQDPLFISGPSGDYYLSQIESGQDQDSPCVDSGDPGIDPWGWLTSTTRVDQEFDSPPADMGYHYPRVCTDEDEDGYALEGGVCGPSDCDDVNPDVNPDRTEIPNNGLDDDCDPSTPDVQPWGAPASILGAMNNRPSSGAVNVLLLFIVSIGSILLRKKVRFGP